jgi:hypothetical protein
MAFSQDDFVDALAVMDTEQLSARARMTKHVLLSTARFLDEDTGCEPCIARLIVVAGEASSV